MIEVEYLSIAEFAEKAGVSKQAIYKQVNNENSQISPFVLRDGKKTLINVSALSELYKVDIGKFNQTTQKETEESENTTQQVEFEPTEATQEPTHSNPKEQPKKTFSTQENQPVSTDYIEFLKGQLAELKAEKEAIEQRLTTTIQEKDNIIKEQSAQLADLAQQVAQIAHKAIIATSQQQYLTAMEKGDKAERDIVEESIENEVKTQKPKKRFFAWFFGD